MHSVSSQNFCQCQQNLSDFRHNMVMYNCLITTKIQYRQGTVPISDIHPGINHIDFKMKLLTLCLWSRPQSLHKRNLSLETQTVAIQTFPSRCQPLPSCTGYILFLNHTLSVCQLNVFSRESKLLLPQHVDFRVPTDSPATQTHVVSHQLFPTKVITH